MTYQDLIDELLKLDTVQLKATVTVEDSFEDECYPLKGLRITGTEHSSLDENYPVLYY